MVNTVLFDLDGTLLPLSEEAFTKAYFAELCKKLAPHGFAPDALPGLIWAGTKAMMRNDGRAPNSERFWDKFNELHPCDIKATRALCDAFYTREFDRVKAVMGHAPFAAHAVKALQDKGYQVVLATNPIFPMVAVQTRLEWIGLRLSDFALITSYENSRYCKPNAMYYREILERIGKQAEDCLMVGNNVAEDMCFSELGGAVYLVTDHMENPGGADFTGYPHGSFAELKAKLDELPSLI